MVFQLLLPSWKLSGQDVVVYLDVSQRPGSRVGLHLRLCILPLWLYTF